MSLPSVPEVRSIVVTAQDDTAVQGAIDDAALIVEPCATAWSDARAKSIIKWIAAHLLSSMSSSGPGGAKPVSSRSLGDASESYGRATLGDSLKGTTYGQQAITLDNECCLLKLGKRPAIFKVL